MCFYGARLDSATILHRAECQANVGYRYWKKIKALSLKKGLSEK